jgi:hypothetical protein
MARMLPIMSPPTGPRWSPAPTRPIVLTWGSRVPARLGTGRVAVGYRYDPARSVVWVNPTAGP